MEQFFQENALLLTARDSMHQRASTGCYLQHRFRAPERDGRVWRGILIQQQCVGHD